MVMIKDCVKIPHGMGNFSLSGGAPSAVINWVGEGYLIRLSDFSMGTTISDLLSV